MPRSKKWCANNKLLDYMKIQGEGGFVKETLWIGLFHQCNGRGNTDCICATQSTLEWFTHHYPPARKHYGV